MITVSASEARQTLPEQLDRVEAGEQVTITRHGKPVAVLVRPEVVRSARTARMWADVDKLDALLKAAGRRRLSDLKGLSSERAEELVADIRAGRDAR